MVCYLCRAPKFRNVLKGEDNAASRHSVDPIVTTAFVKSKCHKGKLMQHSASAAPPTVRLQHLFSQLPFFLTVVRPLFTDQGLRWRLELCRRHTLPALENLRQVSLVGTLGLTVLAVNAAEACWTLADVTDEGVTPVGLADVAYSSVVARVRMAKTCMEEEEKWGTIENGLLYYCA